MTNLKNIYDSMIDGNKTYIIVFFAIMTIIIYNQGIIDKESENLILEILGFTGLATLRQGVEKQKNNEDINY